MLPSGLRLGWAVDFLDNPNDGLEFRFWSGSGDLTLGSGDDEVVYRGTNGVIDITAPQERSGEAMRLTAVMDASDSAVRDQLRHDIGPLRVRIRWLYYDEGQPGGSDGISPFIDRAHWWGPGTDVANWPQDVNDLTTDGEVMAVRFRDVGEEGNFQVGVTYWIKVTIIYITQGWATVAFFDSETNAENATGLRQFRRDQPGRILFTTNDGAGVIVGRFDASQVVVAESPGWYASGKEFIGRLSSPVLEGSRYTVDIESQISDILRGRVLNWSNDVQQQRAPGDKGMEYLAGYAEGIDTKWPP